MILNKVIVEVLELFHFLIGNLDIDAVHAHLDASYQHLVLLFLRQ
jgi:hypothetical protein